MTAQELFPNFSEIVVCDEETLSLRERELLASIFRQAQIHQPAENQETLQVIARAIGDAIAQRAANRLSGEIAEHLLRSPLLQPRISTRPLARTMGTPSVPPPAPPTGAPRPPSPGPPSPGISLQTQLPTQGSNVLSAQAISAMGTPSVPPPSPPTGAPRPPSPGPPSPGISGLERSMTPRPPSPGPPSPATPIPPSGPLPPSTGPHSSWLRDASGSRIAVAHMPSVMPAACVVLDEFLIPSQLEDMMQYALDREEQFVVSEVIAPGVSAGHVDYEHRRSRVLYDLGRPGAALVERIQECLPHILPKLDRDLFSIARIEAQITASNHGDYFRWHCDDGQAEVAKREITFVYFFHREPKEFRGGELRLYNSLRSGSGYVPVGEFRSIVPAQNQLVIFPSALAHEITPVECPSATFASSRFTVNGWFHR